MRSRLPVGAVVTLMAVLAGGPQLAKALELGRLAAFTARQQLRDEVCIAMADGHVSRGERYAILTHAKIVLKPQEYQGLKRAIDRLSPPQTAMATRSTQTGPNEPPESASQDAPPSAESSLNPTIPAGALAPDRMAWTSDAR